jgi:hypothetical protein
MRRIGLIILAASIVTACNNKGTSTTESDSTAINTKTDNVSDGGPNNGLGDTNSYNRMNDTISTDTVPKK